MYSGNNILKIKIINFSFGSAGARLRLNRLADATGSKMSERMSGTHAEGRGEAFAAELDAYNRAFLELELPWRWDADTFRQLLSTVGESDCVAAYIERSQPHLLRVYEKSFLRDLVRDTRERCRQEAA